MSDKAVFWTVLVTPGQLMLLAHGTLVCADDLNLSAEQSRFGSNLEFIILWYVNYKLYVANSCSYRPLPKRSSNPLRWHKITKKSFQMQGNSFRSGTETNFHTKVYSSAWVCTYIWHSKINFQCKCIKSIFLTFLCPRLTQWKNLFFFFLAF